MRLKDVSLCLPVLLGLACAQPRTVIQEVRVPVPVPCPPPTLPPRPVLVSDRMTKASTPAEKVRALLHDNAVLAGYAEQLELLLKAFEKPSETKEK